jgi:DNA polymerase III delta subunit
MRPEELFRATKDGKLPSTLLIAGDDAYLAREWKKLLSAEGFEIQEIELRRTGPEAEAEEAASGISLFSPRRLVWMRATAAPSQWGEPARRLWKRLAAQADGDRLVLAVQVKEARKGKPAASAPTFEDEVEFSIDAGALASWVKRMTQARAAEGVGDALTPDKLSFLQGLDADPLTLDNWVELWMLGGDAWARLALGWGERREGAALVSGGDNPAFAWVDAVLKGRRRESVALLEMLLAEGSEPLQLVGLLAKSVRIFAQLENGKTPTDQPDFLVRKLQRLRAESRPGRGRVLLARLTEADRLLKSSPVKARALLASL